MTDSTLAPVRRALLSVSDKTGLLDFAKALSDRGIELLSTGGTCKLLREAGIPVVEVSDYTGFPEMMDGRVKTLHPKIHGGVLGRRGIDDDVMNKHGISAIDMVVVNLYPFEATVAKADCTLEQAIERKLQQEQESLEYEFRLEKAQKEADRLRIEAAGIRDFEEIISKGLSDKLLKWKGIEATKEIAKSNNTKIVVVGGGNDGLPLILGDN